ncbi:class I glutamine amidotransferase-like protein [Neoconidiobolus thromboides FSU 785]|nr:class I glutamine amidotransferase-like protein [Neoconidiobolus thromboides FSU 785]
MSTSYKIGLLICDDPVPSVVSLYGDYSKIFQNYFQLSLTQLKPNAKLELIPYYIQKLGELPSINNDLKGYIITGSSYSAYLNETWILDLIQFCKKSLDEEPNKRWVGICFGHQLLARVFDDKAVEKNSLGWEVGPLPIELTEEGKRCFNTQEDKLIIHQMHQDHVVTIPSDFQILAKSSVSGIQGYLLKDKILAIQGHPEFTHSIVHLIVEKRAEKGIFKKEQVNEIEDRLKTVDVDQYCFGKIMIQFLLRL